MHWHNHMYTHIMLYMNCKYTYKHHICSCKKKNYERQSSPCSHAEKNYTKTTLGMEECALENGSRLDTLLSY